MLLSLIGIVVTGWLAATGQLGLYIHPRYFVFTTVMAVIAAFFAVLAFAVLPASDDDHEPDEPRPRARFWAAVSVVLVVATAVALLVLPPATLSTSTVEQRDINGSASTGVDGVELSGGNYADFTVKDWAGLLRQGMDAEALRDTAPTLVGFVTPDTDDPENVFYVARFVVTCCAVDAQPIGVPVYSPGWQDDLAVDQWVTVTGRFAENPSIESMQAVAVLPSTVDAIEQPAQPYVY